MVDANVLIMGLAFKENSPDLRNTGVINLVKTFEDYVSNLDVYDPWVDKDEAIHEFSIKPIDQPVEGKYDAIVLAVAHDEFKSMNEKQIRSYGKNNHVLYDIKYLLKENESDGRL